LPVGADIAARAATDVGGLPVTDPPRFIDPADPMNATDKTVRKIADTLTAGPAAARSWQALLGLLVVTVSYLALTPHPLAGIDTGWDKLNHLLAFTALAFAGCLSYPTSRSARTLLLCGLFAFGGLIEILQFFVPGRSSEWGDLLGDAIGIALGAVAAKVVLHIASTQRARSR
jgi:VanZ family protein